MRLALIVGATFLSVIGHFARAQTSGSGRPPLPRPSAVDTVPLNLEAAFIALDRILADSTKRYIRENPEDSLWRFHMGLGMWMRSTWGLWGRSALQRDLLARGVAHPDDMSGLILTTYRRYLRQEPLRIEDDVRGYAEYWRVHAAPDSLRITGCRAGVELRGGMSATSTTPGSQRWIHVGTCKTDGSWWAFEVGRGWYRPDSTLVRQFTSPPE